MEAREPMPRLVFGGAPTIQEAKQATYDLNDALEKTYLSSNATNGQLLSALSDSEDADTKTCLVSESSVSKHAIQALKLLNESPAAQNVVASISCDLLSAPTREIADHIYVQHVKSPLLGSNHVDARVFDIMPQITDFLTLKKHLAK
ncbi:hypothetical protein L1887_06050 [Cichorium endivia]|nr:hypothetical protein L1887_06050 [Cichorium endivia]